MKAIITLALFLLLVQANRAQSPSENDSVNADLKNYRSKWEYGLEYQQPTKNANQIHTVNLQVYFWKQYFKKSTVLIQVGGVASYASGYVGHWVYAGVEFYRDIHHCSAVGLGPSIQFQYTAIQIKRFSLEAEANGAFLLYNTRFPYGGRIYNFMFRAGPNIGWDINHQARIKIGYRWMHVSNGTGVGEQNPYYEGQGVTFTLVKYIP